MLNRDAHKGRKRLCSGGEKTLRSPKGDLFLTGLASRRLVREILERNHLSLKKRLGQNFLVDRNVLDRILDSAELTPEDLVIEIGAGLGTLTRIIARRVKKLWAIEIDRGLVKVLKEAVDSFSNVKIIHADVLKIKFSRFIIQEFGRIRANLTKRIKIIGNIPYSISSTLVRKILEEEPLFQEAWLLLPEDVVKRMKALPGTKAYGSFSILVNFYAKVKSIRKVSPRVFFPVPKVPSVLVKLEKKKGKKAGPKDKALFFKLIRASFAKRRKKLSNALKPFLKGELDSSKIQKASQIDLNRRGETLSLDEFVKLADCLRELSKTN